MCGIFCIVSDKNSKVNIQTINKIAALSRARGEHATGYLLWKNKNEFASIKEPGYNLHLDPTDPDFDNLQFVMGHVRKASQGCFFDNGANHPHIIDEWAMVHNGTSTALLDLGAKLKIDNPTDSDSYAILSLIVRGIKKEKLSPQRAIIDVMGQSGYNDGFSIMLFNTKSGDLFLFRNDDRPMILVPTEQALIAASDAVYIEKSIPSQYIFGLAVQPKSLSLTTGCVTAINVANIDSSDYDKGLKIIENIDTTSAKPVWLGGTQASVKSKNTISPASPLAQAYPQTNRFGNYND